MLFRAVQKTCNSVARALSQFSKDKNIEMKELDFDLISYTTFLEKSDAQSKSVEKVTPSQMRDSSLSIKQEYLITIIPSIIREEEFTLSLSANKLKTKAMITIKEGSVFKKSATLQKEIKDEIWKKKLRAGFFIDIFEDNLDKQLTKLIKILPYDQALKKDLKFTVAQALDPVQAVDAKLTKDYEKKSVESTSIVASIHKGELIASYTLAQEGTPGRACNGKYIGVEEAKTITTQPSIDESVTEKNNGAFIEYFANTDGYALLSQNTLVISQTLALKEANFRSSAVIDAGDEDNDISVNISHEKSHSEDAIGSGVKIDVKELNVNGAIASNVNISTHELNVDAQTHKNSKMHVKNTATIKLHRGDLNAKIANIDILESGKVTASESVNIRKMLGGTVIAPIIKIDEVLANTTIIASELIEIGSILGEHNKLIINPDAIQSYHDELVRVREKYEQQKEDIELQKQELIEKIKEHSSQIDRIKTFQKRVIKATKEGKQPMKQDVLRVKQYKKDSEKLQVKKVDLDNNSLLEALEDQLDKLCNIVHHAQIKSKTSYDGHTKVTFIDPKTKEEISFIPEGKTPIISLIHDGENKPIISTQEN